MGEKTRKSLYLYRAPSVLASEATSWTYALVPLSSGKRPKDSGWEYDAMGQGNLPSYSICGSTFQHKIGRMGIRGNV